MSDPNGHPHLTHAPIDPLRLAASVASHDHGAVCTFQGTARRWSEGRAVLELRYECYADMADKVIDEILQDAQQRYSGVKAAALHRIGTCPLGETSVAVVAASAHRREAFEACRFIIDAIKERAPIWKQEVFSDGSSWVGDSS